MKDSFHNLSSRNYNLYFWNIHPFFTKDSKLRSTISSSITDSCRNPKGLNTILHHSNCHHSSNISPIEILKRLWMKGGKFWTHKQTTRVFLLENPNITSKKSGKAGFWGESGLWGWRQVACMVWMRGTWVIGMQL